MKSLISNENRILLEQIEKKNQEAKHLESLMPQGGGSALGPGALTMAMQFQEVDDIDQFQIDYMLWMRERGKEQQRRELDRRLAALDDKGIVPGKGYPDYCDRFQYMLDTISLMGKCGEMEQAARLANRVFPLAEIAGQNESDNNILTLQWILRSDILWTTANVFNNDELFDEALRCMRSALETAKTDKGSSMLVQKSIASRLLSLADSGVNVVQNLAEAAELLKPLKQAHSLDTEGWSLYFRVLMNLGNYKEANKAAVEMIKTAEAEGKKIDNINSADAAAAECLAQYETPQDFLAAFGPFACPVFSECKKIYLSEAWRETYNEPLPALPIQPRTGTGFLIENLVIYNENDPLISQPIIILHETIHMGVQRGQVYESEGKWLKAFRDVPTAALSTYVHQIEESRKTGIPLPDSLEFFVNIGIKAFKDEPQKCDQYIEKMLEYFELHGQETNSAYQCAGILAGILLGMIGSPSSKEMHSYISHLEVTDHRTAIEKSKRKVDLVL